VAAVAAAGVATAASAIAAVTAGSTESDPTTTAEEPAEKKEHAEVDESDAVEDSEDAHSSVSIEHVQEESGSVSDSTADQEEEVHNGEVNATQDEENTVVVQQSQAEHEEIAVDEAEPLASPPADDTIETDVIAATGADVQEDATIHHRGSDAETDAQSKEPHPEESAVDALAPPSVPKASSAGIELEDLVSMLEGTSVRRPTAEVDDAAGEIPDEY
jgi:hypothetical protein